MTKHYVTVGFTTAMLDCVANPVGCFSYPCARDPFSSRLPFPFWPVRTLNRDIMRPLPHLPYFLSETLPDVQATSETSFKHVERMACVSVEVILSGSCV